MSLLGIKDWLNELFPPFVALRLFDLVQRLDDLGVLGFFGVSILDTKMGLDGIMRVLQLEF